MSKAPADPATVFAALGDRTRLSLVQALAAGGERSISDLAGTATISRQAVSKHLRLLEEVGLVASRRTGRETRFAVRPDAFETIDAYLRAVRADWGRSLQRLKNHVE